MKPSLILLLFLLPLVSSAKIGIVQKRIPANASDCDGAITVRADGSAGPFTIIVYGESLTADSLLFTGVMGDQLIDELCVGSYNVHVFPAAHPSCVTQINTSLQTVTGPAEEGEVEGGEIGGFKAEPLGGSSVSPNPTSGSTELIIAVRPNNGTPLEKDYTIKVLDANGGQINQHVVPAQAKAKRIRFPLTLSKYPPGVYLVRIEHPDGREETVRVVLQ